MGLSCLRVGVRKGLGLGCIPTANQRRDSPVAALGLRTTKQCSFSCHEIDGRFITVLAVLSSVQAVVEQSKNNRDECGDFGDRLSFCW